MNAAPLGSPELERTLGLFDERMRDAVVLVVGDLMLDRYLFGTPSRVSQEAPVLILRHERQSENPGGAGNVACNLTGLGSRVQIVGVAGKDEDGERLLQLLNQAGVNTDAVLRLPNRPTTTKSRITSGVHQLLRIDVEETSEFPVEVAQTLISRIEEKISPEPRAILLSDYAKGVVSGPVARAAIARGKQLSIPVLVDPKGFDWRKYRGATMATPDRIELAEASGVPVHDLDGLLAAGETLRRELEFHFLAVTLGEHGIVLLDETGVHRFPSQAREVFDVSGAGNTVMATIAGASIAGISPPEAMQLANLAAGIVVGRAGTVPIQREELREAVAQLAGPGLGNKICAANEAARRAEAWRLQGHKVVFTNGCFDLVHAGHALHLQEARRLGNRLIIGLNSDRSIHGLKGSGRPILNQQDRAILLASMAAVDAVVVFDEPTPLQLVLAIRPDVMVKGNDYAKADIAGAADVESWGGQVVTLPLVEGKSTTAIVAKICAGKSGL